MPLDETVDEKAQAAVQWLVDYAPKIATAKAEMIRAENRLRVVKSLAMKASDEKSAAAQEREAYASKEYSDAIDQLFEWTRRYEELYALRVAATQKIEWWRSVNANQRQAERGYGSMRGKT